MLTNQGIPAQFAQRLLEQKDPEAVAKVLLNALYLESQGKLQNGAGYIRAGIEDGYDLLPQVATRLEVRRQELANQLRTMELQQRQMEDGRAHAAEQAAISYVLLSFRRQSSTGSWSKLFTSFPSQLWHAILRCRILLYVPKYMN